jgi:hypothetical protein
MNRTNSFEYAMNVWLTAFGLTPLIYMALMLVRGVNVTSELSLLFAFIWGTLFSIPGWVLLYFSTRWLNARYSNPFTVKAILLVLGVVYAYVPFFLISLSSGSMSPDSFNFWIYGSYILAIEGCIIFYDLKPDAASAPVKEALS